jgi:hypothetical protein
VVPVIARAGDIERLVDVAALGLLIEVLTDPGLVIKVEVVTVEEEPVLFLETPFETILLAVVPVLGKGYGDGRNYQHRCQSSKQHYASHTHTSCPERAMTCSRSLVRIDD